MLTTALRVCRSTSTTTRRCFATKVYSWGNGDHGQLGHVGFVKEGVPPTYRELLPKELPILSTSNFQWVAAGNRHSAGLNDRGEVLTWGSGGQHRLGHGTEDDEQGPRLVEGLVGTNIIQVECGDQFTVALSEQGEVYTWGSGGSWTDAGALGHGDSEDCPVPKQVTWFDENDPDNPGIVQIAAGKGHVLALDGDGQVWSWGKGDYGRLGNGGSTSQLTPQPVELFEDIPCMFVAAGEHFSGAISDEGKVWMWGRNDQCQLGLGGGLSMEM
jgi:alpha-tubulin suppressor-like RCC1 family protein